jgi:hypothetical protein
MMNVYYQELLAFNAVKLCAESFRKAVALSMVRSALLVAACFVSSEHLLAAVH